MNREIKFRGQRIDTKEWVYGYYFKTPLTENAIPFDVGWYLPADIVERHCIANSDGRVYVVIPETVGQFSGQLDKDNQEMYEGDLVEDVSYHDSIVCELRFENTGFWLKGNNDNVLFMPSQQYRKVVGNIHDNPVKEGI